MATRQVDLTDTAWVLISSAARGTMQNQSGQIVKFRTDAALPAPSVTVCHILERGASEAWAFEPAQNLYGRLATGSGPLIVTEG
ncbi:hypothetical protein [Aeromonas veronii]|uniref:hypothetical protein n=1 Tax=Aeromonas veronii TaxID=654 RepID=UPI0031FDCBA0